MSKPYALLALVFAGTAAAQAPGASSVSQARVIGEVTAVDASTGKVTLRLDTGKTVDATTDAATSYLRVPPGEKDLQKAAKIALSEVAVGDRVLARGKLSDDQASIQTRSLIVMTKADLGRKHEADRAEWLKRGVSGTVTAVEAAANRITISSRTREGAAPLMIEVSPSTNIRRYSPDSVKFSDAKPSTLAEVKLGDQLRALGNKSEDGKTLAAEELVSGSFRVVAGTVGSVDAATGEIRLTDLQSRKPLLVKTGQETMIRRLPPMIAGMMARRLQGGMQGAMQGAAAGAPARPGGFGGAGAGQGDLQQMLERMPAVALSELKKDDAVIVSSSSGADASRLTAIAVVAGVEPLFTAAPAGRQQQAIGGVWNFDIGVPGMP